MDEEETLVLMDSVVSEGVLDFLNIIVFTLNEDAGISGINSGETVSTCSAALNTIPAAAWVALYMFVIRDARSPVLNARVSVDNTNFARTALNSSTF